MVKTKIIETNEKYDKDEKLVERITREETMEDDEKGKPIFAGGATWWDKLPNASPICCGRKAETISVAY